MKNKLIVRIAEGLGNQLFMYAHAYCLSKKINYDLYIDNTSGYFKKKNQFRAFELDKFAINSEYTVPELRYDNYFLDFKRKIKKRLDLFKHKKSFLIENKDNYKNTSFEKVDLTKLSDLLFVEGYFQSDKYFIDCRDVLINKFKIKENYINLNNHLINELKKMRVFLFVLDKIDFLKVKILIKKNQLNLLMIRLNISKDLSFF